ncbi:acyl-CoA dehydrogenase family protein [Roseomonas sp. CCTCC AB2023176]|uniref:acyl-CoA dehydrogenase family protein n=1 Tax=Roseomonas sp. CCTCC AB2023176 TaxID=3342640 RepID=UPI0035DCE9EE
MDLRFTPEERAFRQEVRDFIAAELPRETQDKLVAGRHLSRRDMVDWHKKLHARGWAVPHWPREWGGSDLTATQRFLLTEELQKAPAPLPLAFNALMVGPVIAAFGTEEQKRRFLPPTASLDIWWCQGFSEPGAGSDLASLKCSAERRGDTYVVNGQKTWTTLAQHADWIFLLVRTDKAAKKQEGISFLLVDMRLPGVTVRPIITIDGAHEVNEVFFDDVQVPADCLIGEENRGWDCAKFLLGNERAGQARVGTSQERLRRLKGLAARTMQDGRPLIEDSRFRDRVAEVEVQLKALEMTTMRVVAKAAGGDRKPDPASSILKVRGSEILQSITELYLEAAGPYALPAVPEPREGANEPEVAPDWATTVAPTYLNWRKLSIYGGSNEVQRSIMAKAFLGL